MIFYDKIKNYKNKGKAMRWIVLIFFIIFINGCSDREEITFRIGTNDWPGYETLHIAENENYYKNVDIKMVEFPSASEVIRAYKNNLIELAALTLDEVLLLKAEGFNPKVILVLDISNGGDVIISQEEYKSFSDLKGKKVGVENSALGAYIISRALEINSLKQSDIQIIPLEFSEHYRAFVNKKVDAVATFEPVKSYLLKGKANIVFDSTQIKGEIVDVLIVRDKIYKKYGDKLVNILNGWYMAHSDLINKPNITAQKIAQRYDMKADEFLNSLEGLELPNLEKNLKLLSGDNPPLKDTARALQKIMLSKNLLSKEINLSNMFTTKTLMEIQK